MTVRHAKSSEISEIMRIYRAAKAYMDANGNATQWEVGYPSEGMVEEDIRNERLYVIEADGGIHAVFFFAVGEDATYRKIYEGKWLHDLPYGVIHRVASDGTRKGVMRVIVSYCRERISTLRIDTHENNLTMQNALGRLGFTRCGMIYLENGDPRIAYQI